MEIQYFVRRSWNDKESQKGGFESLDNAKKCADHHPDHKVYDSSGNEIYVGREFTVAERIEYAASWVEAIVKDNKNHGYNNTAGERWGPDYSCSSLLIEAYEQAGVPVKTAGATKTHNFKKYAIQEGFEDVTADVNLKTGKGMKRGDILNTPYKHMEMYAGNGMIMGARGNANSGKPENGKVGDQTGGEIAKSTYYNYPWKMVLRYVGKGTYRKQYIVQSGAYNVEENADRLRDDLKAKGFSAIVKKEGNMYKVQCGVFNSEANAKRLRTNLLESGFKAIVKAI